MTKFPPPSFLKTVPFTSPSPIGTTTARDAASCPFLQALPKTARASGPGAVAGLPIALVARATCIPAVLSQNAKPDPTRFPLPYATMVGQTAALTPGEPVLPEQNRFTFLNFNLKLVVGRNQTAGRSGNHMIFTFGEALSLTSMVAQAVHLMYKMSKRQEVPSKVHSRILSTLRPSLGGTLATTAVAERGDSIGITSSSTSWPASMWINMLEAGLARSREATILNMIEWMSASEWYDAELAQAEKEPPLTTRETPRKRLTTVVLDKYLKEAQDTTAIGSPGRVASKDNEDRPSSPNSAEVQRRF